MSASATLPAAPATFAQVYHDLETLLLQNTDDLRRVHDEITSLLRIMQEPDSGMFYILLLRLIDRVFGEEATGFRDESINLTLSSVPALPLPPSASSPSVPSPSVSIPVAGRRWIRGGRGGWLALNEGLINAKTTLLLNLFVPNSSLMSIILLRQTPKFSNYVTRKAYEMNLSILPPRLQMKVKNNAFNDCTSVLLSSSLSSVSSYESKFKIVKSSSTIGIEDSYNVFIDPLEYIILCMLKYPLTAPARRVNVSDGFGHLSKPLTPSLLHKEFEKGASHWVRNVTYFNLLHTYLELLFPLSQTSASLSVEDMAIRKLPDGSEFFLSIAVDFWLDTSRIIKRNFPLADALKTNYGSLSLNRMASLSNTSSHQQLHATHPSPMDTLLIDDGAAVGTSQWTVLSLQAAYLFISRILQQKSLNAQLDYLQKAYAQHKSSNARSSRVSLNQLSSPSSSTNDKASSVRYLPHAMLVFQSPMFENLKWIFNKANTIDPSLFICAAELWLLVLEPWKANGGESPSSSSSYSVQWRSYIVAYFHFYTTLLAVFLRSISKMDLVPSSPHSVEDAALLLLLEKLLTVFTPALNDLLEDIISGVYQRLRNVQSTSTNAAEKEESSSVARSIRISECDVAASHHWEMFPDLSIVDRNDAGLVSVKLNAHNECKIIVESLIYRSHSPVKATGIWSVFNDWGGTSSEGKVKNIVRKSSANVVRMITEVLCIVDASVLTQVQSAASKERWIEDVLSDADRFEQTSKLTALGRNQIVTGARKCSKTSLRFQGDQMLRPFMSTEWRVLARYLVDISVHFNNKWNLPADSSYTNSTWAELCRLCMKDRRLVPTLLRKSYRVNLRPLADIWAVGLVLTLFLRTFLYCRLVSTPFFLLLVTLIVAISYVKSNAFFRVR